MRILELFAGIGACSTALKRIGINVEIVDAVEIDKYAIASFNAIHGTDFKVQDITTYNKELKGIDLITHGSPCQDFSVAGKQAGGDLGSGTRSSLLYETIRIVGQIRPKYILWENVKNILSSKHKHNFDKYIEALNILGYNSYYKVLNAKDYGIPQNRERVYTVSIRKDIDDNNFKFPEKQELKLRLKDMLESKVDEKYYLSDKMLNFFHKHTQIQKEKGNGFAFNVTNGDTIAKSITTRVGACRTDDNYIKVIGKLDIKGHDSVKRVYSNEGICPTLTDMQGGNRQPKVLENLLPGAYGRSFGSKGKIQDINGTCNTLQAAMGNGGGNVPILEQNARIRKLTPKECWRLMGFTDEEFKKAQELPTSNTQLYKQAGNSIVVNVLEKIFTNLLEGE